MRLLEGGTPEGVVRSSLWLYARQALNDADGDSGQIIAGIQSALAQSGSILEIGFCLSDEFNPDQLEAELRGFWVTLSRTLSMPSAAGIRPSSIFLPHQFGSGGILWANLTTTADVQPNEEMPSRIGQNNGGDSRDLGGDSSDWSWLVPLRLPPPLVEGEVIVKKAGRPVTTVRQLDAAPFLNESLPKLEADLDRLHEPILDRFQKLLNKLKGEAAPAFEENDRVAKEIMRLAERYGVDLVYVKDGVESTVTVRCVNEGDRGVGHFFIRTSSGAKHLGKSTTWPELRAKPATKGKKTDATY